MYEKRRFKRFSVEIMNIRGKIMFSNMVEILEIRDEGMLLLADMRLNIGSEYILKLDDGHESMKIRGTVESSSIRKTVQSDDGEVIPIYGADLVFIDMNDEKRSRLNRFITHLESDEQEKLKNLIFKIKAPEYAMLDFPSEYIVKKLSLGGMLIESRQPLQPEQRFPMALMLPGHRETSIMGRVASCLKKQGTSEDAFDIGIEFTDISTQDRKNVEDFIKTLENYEELDKDHWKHHKDR